MRTRDIARWSIPAGLLIAGSALAASPTLDGLRDALYGGAASSQISSVIEIFSDPFALTLQTDNSNVGGVGALAATNFKGEPGDVLTGLELSVPLNEIGWDLSSAIKICAFVNGQNSDFLSTNVSGGIDPASPEGSAGVNIGSPPFDFATDAYALVPADQFVTVTNVQGSATITIDGTASEPEWGAPIYVNGPIGSGTENPTGFGDNNDADVFSANGSEIDAIRAFRTGNTLYIHIAGNMESNFNKLDIFIDCDAAGPNQNPLPGTPSPNYAGLAPLANSAFDAAFAPDYYFRWTRGDCGGATGPCHFLDAVDLNNVGATGGGSFVDINTPISFTGPSPSAGTIEAQFDNSNTGGITGPGGGDGTDVAFTTAPSTVTTGVEFSIDLDALGWNGSDTINVAGFIAEGDQMSNQVIGGLPPDTGTLGPGDGVDFDSIVGNQFVALSLTPGSTAPTIDGALDGAGIYTQVYANDGNGTGNSTTLDDATSGGGPDVDPMASEIDGLYAAIVNDAGGNTLYCLVSGNIGDYDKLGVFFDTQPGGQGTLRTDNPDVSGNFFNNLGGLVFDSGVEPDFAIVYNLGTNAGPDTIPGNADDFVEHFADGIQLLTLGAEDPDGPPAGGPFDGGPKDSTPLMGDLVSRTGFGNNTLSDVLFADGSELDNAAAFVDADFLYIMLSGNIETNFTKLEVFMDIIPFDSNTQTGGQNTLVYDEDPVEIEDPPGSGNFVPNPNYTGNCDLDFQALNRMGGPFPIPGTDPQEFQDGFTFDADFYADHWVFATAGGDDTLFPGEPEWFGGIARLFNSLREDPANPGSPDPGECVFWGGTSFSDFGDFIDTPGETAGLYIDNSNTLGVTGGPDQYEPDDSAPSGVTTGIEIRIPLEQILVPSDANPLIPVAWDGQDPFKLCVFLNGGFHSFSSNQYLQPICAPELGEPRLIDLQADHPGDQYLALSPNGVMTAYTKTNMDPPACVEPVGACCINQVCTENVLEGDCLAQGGTFLGDGTDCTGGCPAPEGACCLAGGNCAIFTEADCLNAGGTYQGDDTTCESVVCPAGGACCYACPDGNTCFNAVDLADCRDNHGGLYAGDGTDCATFDCNTLCRADLDGDGDTDVFDFAVFGPNFGLSPATRCQGDFNCDGVVNIFDFGFFGPDFGCVGAATGTCP